jgi:hypothetical protein
VPGSQIGKGENGKVPSILGFSAEIETVPEVHGIPGSNRRGIGAGNGECGRHADEESLTEPGLDPAGGTAA